MPVAIDTAVLDATFFQMSPPAIVRPAIDLGADAAALEREFREQLDQSERGLAGWIEGTDARLDALDASVAAAPRPVDPVSLDRILEAAVLIERDAERYAMERKRSEKRLARATRDARRNAPHLVRVIEASTAEANEFYRRETAVRLDGALRLRAIRAKYLSDNSTGLRASTPTDVDSVFRELLAS